MRRLTIVAAMCLLASLSAPAFAQLADSVAFVEAVRKSDGDKVTELLNKRPLGLLDSRAEDGDTALIIALARRDEEWTAFLLGKGASPDLAGRNGDTPLITASRVGFSDAVDWLLAEKARVNADNKMGETALIIAVQQHQLPITRTLLRAGADPDKTDFAGYSARDYAKRDPRARDILRLIETSAPKPGAKP